MDADTVFLPLRDRLLVRRYEPMDLAGDALIVAPESAQRESNEGEVLATGAGYRGPDGATLPLTVQAGESVLFSKYSGQAVVIDGEELLLLREDDVLAVMD